MNGAGLSSMPKCAARGVATAVVWGRSGGTYDRASDIYYLTNYYGNNSGQGFDNDLAELPGFFRRHPA